MMDKLSEMRVEYFVSKRKNPFVKFVLCFCSLCPCLHVGVFVLDEIKTYTICCGLYCFPNLSFFPIETDWVFYPVGSSWNPSSGADVNGKWNSFVLIGPPGRCSLCANKCNLLQNSVFFHCLAPADWLFLVDSQTAPTQAGCFICKTFRKFNRVKLQRSMMFRRENWMTQSQANKNNQISNKFSEKITIVMQAWPFSRNCVQCRVKLIYWLFSYRQHPFQQVLS